MKISPHNNLFKDLEFWKNNYLNDNKFYFSKNTYKNYKRIIEEFIDFCVEKSSEVEFSIKDINKFIVNEFLQKVKNNNTKSLYLTILKTFFKYISENNEDGIDLLENIQNIKIKKELKEVPFYTQDEIKEIIKALLEKFKKTKSLDKKKKAFLVYLLIKTGARASEIISLKKDDIEIIEFEDDKWFRIKIKGKGDKERFVYVLVDDENYEMYKTFLKTDKKVTYNGLYTFNKILLLKLDIQNKGLHAYRHSFARKWVEDNKNLQTLSELLGHKSILTTSKFYAKSSEKGKLKALKDLK